MDQARFWRRGKRRSGGQEAGRASARSRKKALHAALKAYYEPDAESREIALGGFVADIVGEEGSLRSRRAASTGCAASSRSFWKRRASRWCTRSRCGGSSLGSTGDRRGLAAAREHEKGRSVRRAAGALQNQAAAPHPNFRLRLALLALTDYKYLDGYGPQRKMRATRGERVPEALLGQIDCVAPADYLALLPADLRAPFTAEQLAKAVRRPVNQARAGVNVLCALARSSARVNRGALICIIVKFYKISFFCIDFCVNICYSIPICIWHAKSNERRGEEK